MIVHGFEYELKGYDITYADGEVMVPTMKHGHHIVTRIKGALWALTIAHKDNKYTAILIEVINGAIRDIRYVSDSHSSIIKDYLVIINKFAPRVQEEVESILNDYRII